METGGRYFDPNQLLLAAATLLGNWMAVSNAGLAAGQNEYSRCVTHVIGLANELEKQLKEARGGS
jgi:hypothetical protein